MHRSSSVYLTALVLALAPACGQQGDAFEPSSPGSDGSSDSDDENNDDASNDNDDDDDSGTSDGLAQEDGGGSDSPWDPGPHWMGIAIDAVTANQGVGITIGDGGSGIPSGDRTAPIVAGRPMLVRATWFIVGDWDPREIEARLTLTDAQGNEETFIDAMVIDGDADLTSLDGTFAWSLTAEQVRPGLQYRVELLDHRQPAEDIHVSSLPADGGDAPVGIPDGEHVIRVVVVPFAYDDGDGCSTLADTSEETLQAFHTQLYSQNPVDTVEIVAREPIAYDGPLDNISDALADVVALRFADNASSETYYYGLIDTCSGEDGVGGVTGMAFGIPSDPTAPGAAAERTAIGVWTGLESASQIFVHEIGHSQGRYHVACGGPTGVDPDYPGPAGDIVDWGYGVLDHALRDPGHKDYMTYCGPQWVSAFGWNKTHATIEALGDSGEEGDGAQAPIGEESDLLVVGMISPDGAERWMIVPGTMDTYAADPGLAIELTIGDIVVSSPAHKHTVADGDATVVIAALPEGGREASDLTRVDHGRRVEVPRASVRDFRDLRETD